MIFPSDAKVDYFAKMNFKSAFLFCHFFWVCSSLVSQNIPDGLFKGALDYGHVQCPIRFEISESGSKMTLINGDERALFDIEPKGDSLLIPMKPFDAYISAKYADGKVEGTWNKPYRNLSVAFNASQFSRKEENISELNTEQKWKMTFKPGQSGEYPAVGLMEFQGENVTGTVLTETGDFRYFEGTTGGDSLVLSAFDGTHGFLLIGGKNEDESWSGDLHFEPGYSESWMAIADENAEISDPFEMVEVDPSTHVPYYDLLGAGSGKGAIDVSQYEGKVLIIQVFGTWCPNSLDQMNYLLDWYPERPGGVEILAVTYEPNYSKEYGLRRIDEYSSHLKIPYDVVLGGALSKSQAALPFPFLKRLEAFPTLVLVDKAGYARYVHSYFNGPATGDLYADFISQFNQKVNELVAE